MNADASQPPLPVLWFVALVAAAGVLVAVTLLTDRLLKRHRRARALRDRPIDLWPADVETDIAQAVDLANSHWTQLDEVQMRREIRKARGK